MMRPFQFFLTRFLTVFLALPLIIFGWFTKSEGAFSNITILNVIVLLALCIAIPSDVLHHTFKIRAARAWQLSWGYLSALYFLSGISFFLHLNTFDPTTIALYTAQILFPILALFHLSRGWAWLVLLGYQIIALLISSSIYPALTMLLLHLFTFDSRWIVGRSLHATSKPILFFDGYCVLCNGFASLLIAEDEEERFMLSPLDGTLIRSTISEHEIKGLPDSIVIKTHDGGILTRSDAVIYVGRIVGGMAAIAANVVSLIPRAIRDFVYSLVAWLRYKIFGKTTTSCSLIPEQIRKRIMS